MKLHQAINGYELDAVWDALATEFQRNGDRERIRSWLRSNVNHHLDQQLPRMHDPRIKAPHYDLGLKWSMLLTPRDHVLLPPNNMSKIDVLDLFKFPELAEAYNAGCLLYRWHTESAALDEVRQRLHHLIEGLQAIHGKKKNWASISVEAAVKIAEEWVAELNRKKLESGGQTSVLWNQTIEAPRPPAQPPGADGHLANVNKTIQTHLIQFHLLEDETAYKSEGQVMSHCVAGYWSPENKSRAIVSMRNVTTNERLLTIELNGTTVVQERGYKNREPTAAERNLLQRFYDEKGYTKYTLTTGIGQGVRLADMVAVRPLDNPLANLNIGIGNNGARLFEHITSMDVSQDHRGGWDNPSVRIEGIVSREGIAELQAQMRRG